MRWIPNKNGLISDNGYTIEYKKPLEEFLDGTWSCFRNESNELRFELYEGVHLNKAVRAAQVDYLKVKNSELKEI